MGTIISLLILWGYIIQYKYYVIGFLVLIILLLIIRRVVRRRRIAAYQAQRAAAAAAASAPAPAPAVSRPAEPVERVRPSVSGDARTMYSELYSAPESMNGMTLAYSYLDVGFYVPDDLMPNARAVPPREELYIAPDPSNPYDSEAVAIYCNSRKIGYMYRGKLRDMWRDFADRPDRMYYAVSQPWQDGKPIFGLFFYKVYVHVSEWKPGADAKAFRLSRSGSAAAQEAISTCSVGDEVDVESEMGDDYEYHYYVTSLGVRLGNLPASARKYIDEHDYFTAHISDIDEDESGKYVVTVTLEPDED